jgi:hypothetical protein
VYNFVPGDPGPNGTVESGKLVVTDAAYQSGFASVDYQAPASGQAIQGPIRLAKINYHVQNGLENYEGGVFFNADSPGPGINHLRASLEFADDGTLSGKMLFHDKEDQAFAFGAGSWRVTDVGSDFFGGDPCGAPTCDVGTGTWNLAPSTTADVPAPSAWSLFALSALGIFGLIGLRWKV